MLKIERHSRGASLHLTQTGRRIFSRPLLLAMAAAMGIHLFAFVLFRFPIYKPRYDPPNKVLVIPTPLARWTASSQTFKLNTRPSRDYLLPKSSFPTSQLSLGHADLWHRCLLQKIFSPASKHH